MRLVKSTPEEVCRRYAGIPVPRYTSYPTAADFSPAVKANDHARWLRRLDGQTGVSIYLHVPYCRDLCRYCGCHAKAVRRPEVVERYREALIAEIALVASLQPLRLTVDRLHWGGGTPSILGLDGLASVILALKACFDVSDGAEHAIELDPRHVDADLAQGLAALGINRVSLGVQDVDPAVQEAIGRIQPIETVAAAVAHVRAAGISQLNFDLIYGLPEQTVESLGRTCDAVVALGPDRIACYGYAHLPARRANQRLIDASRLPWPDERFDQANEVSERLLAQGYMALGIDHFARADDPLALAAREGRLRRNFQGYTDDDCQVLLGFGASSISSFPDGYVQNISDVAAWARAVGAGELPSARGKRLSDADRLRARVIRDLMCSFQVDLEALEPEADFADEIALLRPMAADGMLTIKGRLITMTDAGKPMVRVAAAVFDQYRRDGGGSFSRAV